ncbi:hypothetical protein H7K45_28655 [Mycobacterium yunnanensis]|uniref:RyR domain-containing protein n=1 Tax=Mycobacterium yunnanensis TaxID=368477 RepID=A0A9X3C4J4_9MYCO|nr:hypothetical protein [Mycobacterium yunnanensis]MCV7424521.1 hypothetical protein [Mycobacterium yunnanensis]
MSRTAPPPATRWIVGSVGLVVVVYLSTVAVRPQLLDRLPLWLSWFGRPGSIASIALSAAVLVAVCVAITRSSGTRQLVGVSFTLIALLVSVSAVLGLSSYWACHDATHPAFFTPMMATAQLVKGGTGDYSLGGHVCPYPTPVGLEIARLAALSAFFTGVIGVVAGVFRTQTDRLRSGLATSVTAVVGLSDDTLPVISRVARTLDRRETLVVLTGVDDARIEQVRRRGAHVVLVDFDDEASVLSLRLWCKLERLHLLGADPALNLLWLDRIGTRLADVGHRRRVPLTVRIDDPWLAEAWRAQQFGGTDERWAADVVGKYQATAVRLVERIRALGTVDRILLCGGSQLMSAICAHASRDAVERAFYCPPDSAPPPTLTLVGVDAEQFLDDHQLYWRRLGVDAAGPVIDAVAQAPTVATLQRLLAGTDPTGTAVVLINTDAALASRLAARFPQTAVFAPDVNTASVDDAIQVAGRLQSYSPALGIEDGEDVVQDVWERAAMLIHERYVATRDPAAPRTSTSVPWAELSDFHRGSNRRMVRNVLWMVERVAGHTWNTVGDAVEHPVTNADVDGRSPTEQLAAMGIGADAALEMARLEHEDWRRYYHQHGWRSGPVRDDEHRTHDKLLGWDALETDERFVEDAVRSLAATLWSLRRLGYRSRPLWRSFARVGTVTAERRDEAFTWTSDGGQTMTAAAGDWSVRDQDDRVWSVRDDIFRDSYDELGDGRWRRRGGVQARPARAGETVDTLEGPTTAREGDWIVRGSRGEEWPVGAAEFTRRYAAEPERHPRGEPES